MEGDNRGSMKVWQEHKAQAEIGCHSSYPESSYPEMRWRLRVEGVEGGLEGVAQVGVTRK